jgi:acyl-CoA synthetase (NDP forming)
MKYFVTLTLALACFFGLAVAVNAQDTTTKEKVKVKGGAAQTVSYTGCVATGSETTTYVLNHVVPVSKTVEDRSGAVSTTTTTTSYVLVPGSDTVTFTKLVGHKVEVTGVMIPGGKETKVEKKTKIERDNAPDVKIKEQAKSNEGAMPHFRVASVKDLPDPCTP